MDVALAAIGCHVDGANALLAHAFLALVALAAMAWPVPVGAVRG